MKGKTTIARDGTSHTELLEHSERGAHDLASLVRLLGRPNLHEELHSSLEVIQKLALHLHSTQTAPAVRDALAIIARTADLCLLFNLTKFDSVERNDFRRMTHAALEVLSGNGMTATEGFRITDGSYTMRIVSALEKSRLAYASGDDEARELIVERVRTEIGEISGRKPAREQVVVALSPRTRQRTQERLPGRWESYQELLAAVGQDRRSEAALKRMWTRYKATLSP